MPVAVASRAVGFVGVCRGSGSHDLSLLRDLLCRSGRCRAGETERSGGVVARLLLLVVDPFGEGVLRDRLNDDRHQSVIDATNLIALAVIDTLMLDAEP